MKRMRKDVINDAEKFWFIVKMSRKSADNENQSFKEWFMQSMKRSANVVSKNDYFRNILNTKTKDFSTEQKLLKVRLTRSFPLFQNASIFSQILMTRKKNVFWQT